MRIGYVLRYWPTLSETFVAREIAELRRRGHAVDVVAIGSRADADLAEPTDVAVLRPPRGTSGLRVVPALLRRAGRHPIGLRLRDLGRAAWVADQGAARGWERVHAHFAGEAAEWAARVAEWLGVPFSVTTHAVDLFVPRPSLPELLRRARPAITVCAHHQRWIADQHRVDAAVVRCGVPLDVPQADPGTDGARFVCVARDVPKKGLDDLVAALRETPDATLRLVSDAHRLGGPGVWVGPLRPSAVAGVLARAQAFALACRIAPNGDRDGLPVALLEAMAAGLPVVTTAVAGIPEVADEEVGWVIPADEPVALRQALWEAAGRPEERARRGDAGRKRLRERGLTVKGQVDALLAAWA